MQITQKSETEFIIVMASLMAMVALSIDAILPAINDIGTSIGITDSKDNQSLITMIFLGLGVGQLITGPLSDSLGRKPIIYIGIIVFTIASFICVFATTVELMILGRILQGVGLSAPRTVSMAMVRDRFNGDYMAKVMSFVTMIFILIPVIAPAIGKLMLDLYGWKSIFYGQLIYGLFVVFWFYKRQPETLKAIHKKNMTISLFVDGFKEFLKHKQSVIYTLVSGFIMGSFMVYLSASQQIFQEQYGLIDEFPFIFSGLAVGVGVSTFLNGKFVIRFGMLRLATIFFSSYSLLALIYVISYYGKPNPDISIIISFFFLQLFSIGFVFGNVNALAMQPIGHIAGIGAAIYGFVSTVMGVPIATFIGTYVTTTAIAVFVGFFLCGGISLLLMLYLNKFTTVK